MIDLLFLGFSINLILACLLTISAVNAVSALMALIFAFINGTCIFFLMELEFIGLLFLIVYLGAICVLFLFAVMLFNLKDIVRVKTTSFILKNLFLLITIAFIFLNLFQFFIIQSPIYLDAAFAYPPLSSLNEEIMRTSFYEDLAMVADINLTHISSSSIFALGQVLYGRYLIYLLLAAIVLLVSMIGAVTLIAVPKEQSQLQHSLHQISRKIRITNMR